MPDNDNDNGTFSPYELPSEVKKTKPQKKKATGRRRRRRRSKEKREAEKIKEVVGVNSTGSTLCLYEYDESIMILVDCIHMEDYFVRGEDPNVKYLGVYMNPVTKKIYITRVSYIEELTPLRKVENIMNV